MGKSRWWISSRIVKLLVLCIAILILLLWSWFYALPWLEAKGYIPYIQEVVDEQCPELDIVVTVKGYSGDPFPAWSSSGVYCRRLTSGDDWECNCN